ncbi:MAG: 3-phosphoserine/phosphohydroxythreonine transaminase [Gammaproteobacteria bacterium]|jgi:phosphoserine aminotransferase
MRAWNFSAGPAAIPLEVLKRAQQELLEFGSQQASIMEISHRSKDYEAVAFGARDNLKSLLNISDEFEILFLQGGATLQFALLPLNFAQNQTTEHIITGAWSKKAHSEASKLGSAHILATSADTNFTTIPELNNLSPSDGAAYLHYADNETIHGVEFKRVPDINLPKFVDMSSIILGKQIDVNQYDLIYAGAQKNIGPAGLTVVIARKKLLETCNESIPSILNLQKHAENDSMLNTPPTFAWYLAGLVFEWLSNQGGVRAIEELNNKKASLLYDYIDASEFYSNPVDPECRSIMNIPFILANADLDQLFLEQSKQAGLLNLKGHRSVGGMRASIYNAIPLAAIHDLINFMESFAKENA